MKVRAHNKFNVRTNFRRNTYTLKYNVLIRRFSMRTIIKMKLLSRTLPRYVQKVPGFTLSLGHVYFPVVLMTKLARIQHVYIYVCMCKFNRVYIHTCMHITEENTTYTYWNYCIIPTGACQSFIIALTVT